MRRTAGPSPQSKLFYYDATLIFCLEKHRGCERLASATLHDCGDEIKLDAFDLVSFDLGEGILLEIPLVLRTVVASVS